MLHKPRGFVSQDSDAATARAQQRLAIKLLTWKNQAHQHGYAMRCAGDDGAVGIREQVEPCRLKGLAVVGRLDAESSGLLLFSQDGNLARSILGSGSEAGEKLE